MMSKAKLFVLSLLAVAAISGLASSIAAAEEQPHYIKGGTELTEELKANSTLSKFTISITIAKLTIQCEGSASGGRVGLQGKSKLKITFTTCSLQGAANCSVTVPFVLELQDQLVYAKGKKGEEIYDIFFSASSKKFAGLFAVIDFAGSGCALAGEQPIKGSAIAVPATKPGEETKSFKLTFSGEAAPTGKYFNVETSKEEEAGKLSFGSDPTFLSGEATLELESAAAFGAI
jgi:hypothetical protein